MGPIRRRSTNHRRSTRRRSTRRRSNRRRSNRKQRGGSAGVSAGVSAGGSAGGSVGGLEAALEAALEAKMKRLAILREQIEKKKLNTIKKDPPPPRSMADDSLMTPSEIRERRFWANSVLEKAKKDAEKMMSNPEKLEQMRRNAMDIKDEHEANESADRAPRGNNTIHNLVSNGWNLNQIEGEQDLYTKSIIINEQGELGVTFTLNDDDDVRLRVSGITMGGLVNRMLPNLVINDILLEANNYRGTILGQLEGIMKKRPLTLEWLADPERTK